MADATLVFRPYMALLPVGGLYLATLWRLIALQVMPQPEAEQTVRDIVGHEVILEAPRGTLLDRNGLVLAEDRPVWTLLLDAPAATRRWIQEMEDGGGMADQLKARVAIQRLAAAAGGDAKTWERSLLDAAVTRKVLARDLTELEAARVREALADCGGNGLRLERSWRRAYPQGRSLAHAIGLPGSADGARRSSGLERVCEADLANEDGLRRALRVAGDHGLDPMMGFEPVKDGSVVRTTLDAALAAFAREELQSARLKYKADSACAVAIDVRTGEVLLIEAVPDYDPNTPGVGMEVRTTKQGKEVLGWMLPALWPLEPGSTVKPFVVAAALQAGVLSENDRFENHGGAWNMPDSRRVIHNASEVPKHSMTPHEVLQHSSNIGAAKIGMRLGSERMRQLWTNLNIHGGSGLPVFDQERGLFPSEADWKHPNANSWCVASTAFGHAFSLTPLRLSLAWAALVNGGLLLEPRWFAGQPRQAGTRVFDEAIARKVTGWVESVVSERKDTVLPKWDDLRWGGKSGTAKKTHTEGYTTFFVAFGPVEIPEVVVVVVVENPTVGKARGSLMCGPAAGKILRRALELRGSRPSHLDSTPPRAKVQPR
jgi:cell division protein FtsI (penicillin-binding protein 3)